MAQQKEALFWKAVGNSVQCQLCPHFCVLENNEIGKCRARQNKDGKLISLVYGKLCSMAIDPIEKKPLYHFFPGEKTLSIATAGCNLSCKNCQNWQISQANVDEVSELILKPEDIIKEAIKRKIKIISYTYTEPTIFYEYMLDTAKLAGKHKIKNVIVSNGFINPLPLKELCKYIDAANIDLKSINNEFYERVCNARLEPVLKALEISKENNTWLEITNLIIPEFNDSTQEIEKLVSWIVKNLGKEIPLHFSAFYPQYKMLNLPSTPAETLKKARNIAIAKGMKYVYTGNIKDNEGDTTFCPKCKKALIRRKYFDILENNIKKGKCSCKEKIAGVWK